MILLIFHKCKSTPHIEYIFAYNIHYSKTHYFLSLAVGFGKKLIMKFNSVTYFILFIQCNI